MRSVGGESALTWRKHRRAPPPEGASLCAAKPGLRLAAARTAATKRRRRPLPAGRIGPWPKCARSTLTPAMIAQPRQAVRLDPRRGAATIAGDDNRQRIFFAQGKRDGACRWSALFARPKAGYPNTMRSRRRSNIRFALCLALLAVNRSVLFQNHGSMISREGYAGSRLRRMLRSQLVRRPDSRRGSRAYEHVWSPSLAGRVELCSWIIEVWDLAV